MFEQLRQRLSGEMDAEELGKILQLVTQSQELSAAERLELLRLIGARFRAINMVASLPGRFRRTG